MATLIVKQSCRRAMPDGRDALPSNDGVRHPMTAMPFPQSKDAPRKGPLPPEPKIRPEREPRTQHTQKKNAEDLSLSLTKSPRSCRCLLLLRCRSQIGSYHLKKLHIHCDT